MRAGRRRRRNGGIGVAIITLVTLVIAVAGCTIDRAATGENLIKDVEKTYVLRLDAAQKDCLQKLVISLSIDEINELNAAKASPALRTKFVDAELKCVPAISGSVPANSSPTVSTTTTTSTGTTSTGNSTPLSNTATSLPPFLPFGTASPDNSTTTTVSSAVKSPGSATSATTASVPFGSPSTTRTRTTTTSTTRATSFSTTTT